jgi:tetratricopeptide (TPR) repeat protein
MRVRPILPLLLAAAAAAALTGIAEDADPLAALNEGNRLFRNGQLEAAVDAYRAGYSPDAPHPTLAYNLGTALHHLDRLPEAILWYRRAGDSDDPWVAENLWLARRSLGTQALPPGGLAGVLAPRADLLRWLAVLCAWGAAAMVVARRELPLWAAAVALAACVALYGTAVAVERWGPRPAVLLAACATSAGELPAGTEAWVRRQDDGGFKVTAADAVCPAAAVALVALRRRSRRGS